MHLTCHRTTFFRKRSKKIVNFYAKSKTSQTCQKHRRKYFDLEDVEYSPPVCSSSLIVESVVNLSSQVCHDLCSTTGGSDPPSTLPSSTDSWLWSPVKPSDAAFSACRCCIRYTAATCLARPRLRITLIGG